MNDTHGQPKKPQRKMRFSLALIAEPMYLAKIRSHWCRQSEPNKLSAPIEATYDLLHIKEAVAAAAKGGRSGKILLTPNAGHAHASI